jgi:hypothetical protein
MPLLQINYAAWLKETNMGLTSTRSSTLKLLDKAIEEYNKISNDANAYKIAAALTQWDRSRGPDAAQSGRDKQGAVATLRVQLATAGISADEYRAATFRPEAIEALKYQTAERRKVLISVFEHADVVFVGKKPEVSSALAKLKAYEQKAKAAKQIGGAMGSRSNSGSSNSSNSSSSSSSSSFMSGAGSALEGVMRELKEGFTRLVAECFEVMLNNFSEIASKLAGIGHYIFGLVTDIIGTVAPFVGHVLDAKKMIVGWAMVAKNANTIYDIGKRQHAVDFGAPTAAFQGLQSCMEQEQRQQLLMAGNATLTFAAKTGAAFADGGAGTGTAIGIVSALAEFARQLYQLAAEWKATKRVKEVLRGIEPLDLSVFKTYPLMGCYMLTSATLSDIIPLDCFGTPGWMDVIEQRKKDDVDKILSKAQALIKASPFEFTNLPKTKKEGTERKALGFAAGLVKPVLRSMS